MTHDELIALAIERFGPDERNWAFVCPNCGDVATGADFIKALEESGREHRNGGHMVFTDILGQECIGRTLGALQRGKKIDRGCDWAAYGLFPGPLTVTMPNGAKISTFNLAEAS